MLGEQLSIKFYSLTNLAFYTPFCKEGRIKVCSASLSDSLGMQMVGTGGMRLDLSHPFSEEEMVRIILQRQEG